MEQASCLFIIARCLFHNQIESCGTGILPVHKNGTRWELVNLLSKLAWLSSDRNLIYRQKCAQCAIDLLLGAKNGPTAGMRSNTAPNVVVAAVWRLKIKNLG
ncbi:hypothetical protein [Microcoleus sp. D2_18a_B4]|uniref:hypothetical protein n=1 Tax=Microcoleus sp. D2_18a_B4 TaxID=3055329 RepID=UPI0040407839